MISVRKELCLNKPIDLLNNVLVRFESRECQFKVYFCVIQTLSHPDCTGVNDFYETSSVLLPSMKLRHKLLLSFQGSDTNLIFVTSSVLT